MTIVPQTSPAPKPILIFTPAMSRIDAEPQEPAATPTPLPRAGAPPSKQPDRGDDSWAAVAAAGGEGEDEQAHLFPEPKLRLEIRDLGHSGAQIFLSAVNATSVLRTAVRNVQRLLYGRPSDAGTRLPPTRSVTLVLRDMGGVAYTTGTELDEDHKEIHLSLPYVVGAAPAGRARAEITGVLTHELVHCYQWNAEGSCPGGLIEGIADWVRLTCGLSPPHWFRETLGPWDRGYQHTAYFLAYLEARFGDGTVRRINERLRLGTYEEKPFWTGLLGRPVEQLWADYVDSINKSGAEGSGGCGGDGEQQQA